MKSQKILIALLLAATVLTIGCKKDGVYRPSEKIAAFSFYYERDHQRYNTEKKIWESIQKDSTRRYTTEKWVWNDKQLNRIDLYDQGSNAPYCQLGFVYDGNRLTRVNISNTKHYVTYEYDGRRITRMTVHSQNGDIWSDYCFDYDGKKINTVTITGNYLTAKSEATGTLALMPVLGDIEAAHSIESLCQKTTGSKSDQTVFEITWKGNNIKSIKNRDSGATEVTYTHDNKTNPLRGLLTSALTGINELSHTSAYGNENNITSADYGTEKQSYSYTYSDDLPTSRSRSIVDHYTQGYRYVKTYITYYEYIED